MSDLQLPAVLNVDSFISLTCSDEGLLLADKMLGAGMESVGVNADIKPLVDPNRVVQ